MPPTTQRSLESHRTGGAGQRAPVPRAPGPQAFWEEEALCALCSCDTSVSWVTVTLILKLTLLQFSSIANCTLTPKSRAQRFCILSP